jgi:hypothetical protein
VNPGAGFAPLVSKVLPGRNRPHAPSEIRRARSKVGDLGELPHYWPQACPIVGTRMPSPVGAGRNLRAW